MFSTETPPQARRKSFKAFTTQLPQPQQHLPPSASLILGQTSKVNPRLPRPSSSAITLSSVPYSYAYGAAGSPPQLASKKTSNSAQTVDTTDSISPRSRSSRGRQPALHPDDMSIASVSSDKNGPEPAQIRYARLNQRLQNTGSAHAPSQPPPPKVIVPKPKSTHLNDTSVNIASAFERAQMASRSNAPQSSNTQDRNPLQQNSHHFTRPENLQPSYNRPIPSTSNQRSIDPSYKYRPGDSASSDSEAGEGIADKRLRREKKARLEQEKQEHQSGTAKKRTVSKRRRTNSRRSNGSDDLTDSDEDTGPGIAATRGRRIPKENQPGNASAGENVNRRHKDGSRKKDTNQRTDSRSDMNDDDGSEVEPTRPKRQAVQSLDNDATPHARKQQPSATYFLSDPEASMPPEESARNQSYDQEHTVGTTESSRSALRLSGDSYDFAEEERIVKALGKQQTRQQHPLATETSIGDGSTSDHHRQESSPNFGWAGSSRERIRSDDHACRSDSGMREIEEIIASSRQTAHSKPEKPRVLPLPIPHQKTSIPTIIEESEHELRKQPDTLLFNSIPESLGTKWGKQLISLLSHLFRAEFWNRFTWLVLMGSVALALLINSLKTGDISFPLLSLFSSKRASSTFSAPTAEIQNLAELIERLKSLESAVTTISVEQRQDSKNLQQSLVRDKIELDYKGLRTDLESVIIGHRHDHGQLEKIKQTVEGLGGRLESLDNSNANSVTRDEARVMIEQVWSVKGRDGSSVDLEKLKQSVLKSIDQEGYVTKAQIGKLLESELQVMGTGFEHQLDSKLEKIRQELQAPRSRTRNLDGSVSGEVMESVQGMIEEAIERYSQDEIGKRDFALYSGGARVIPQLTSNTYEISVKSWSQKFIGLVTGADSVIRGRGPITALSPEVELGKCWPIAGPQGHLAVYLSRKILVTEVSIEHVSKSLAYELDSAPREIEVWSIEDSTKLLDVVYDPNLPARIQTFKVPAHLNYVSAPSENQLDTGASENGAPTDAASTAQTPVLRQGILFKIKSNHGNPYYTCVYRFRVHGLMESELNLK
ncbi:hypothetical protein PtA15_15A418 [Puccinia triticina]|uniref:SUN domain-containing protein n=1 Tax=Puccinia triticina TaxID=208348 RepID=A0ABY7D327_9BASI|nr:uncharacterized protein PtA15_15A418 [Puccinia triticina]WAQ92024.1 hypothetical protein PtA15_15A418 [Puccinia triticina]WAR62835.1 hypothetical protein PtB15_15B423 [Puccinia triticina]